MITLVQFFNIFIYIYIMYTRAIYHCGGMLLYSASVVYVSWYIHFSCYYIYIIIYIIQGVGLASLAHSLRFTAMDINFSSVAEKDAFCGRLSSVRDLLTPAGSQTLNNYDFCRLCLILLVNRKAIN